MSRRRTASLSSNLTLVQEEINRFLCIFVLKLLHQLLLSRKWWCSRFWYLFYSTSSLLFYCHFIWLRMQSWWCDTSQSSRLKAFDCIWFQSCLLCLTLTTIIAVDFGLKCLTFSAQFVSLFSWHPLECKSCIEHTVEPLSFICRFSWDWISNSFLFFWSQWLWLWSLIPFALTLFLSSCLLYFHVI